MNCTENSDDYSSTIDLTSARDKSTPTNCHSMPRHFYIIEGVTKGFKISKGTRLTFDVFTTSFVVKVDSVSQTDITFIKEGKPHFQNSFIYINYRLIRDNWSI